MNTKKSKIKDSKVESTIIEKKEKIYTINFKIDTIIWNTKYFWISNVSKEIYNSLKDWYFVKKWDIILL